MIFANPTKYGAGIVIHGDYHDLEALEGTIDNITEKTIHGPVIEEFVQQLSYEVRKAYEGQRDQHHFSRQFFGEERDCYFSFKQLWPVFLMQVALLRWLAAFQETNRNQQADLFRLEACAEDALMKYDPFVGNRCMQWLRFFPGVASNYRFHFVGQCCVEYVSGKDTGKRRFKRLPDILDALLQKSDEYRDFEMHLEKSAKAKGVDPQDFRDVDPWPEFRW